MVAGAPSGYVCVAERTPTRARLVDDVERCARCDAPAEYYPPCPYCGRIGGLLPALADDGARRFDDAGRLMLVCTGCGCEHSDRAEVLRDIALAAEVGAVIRRANS